jgi:hypothetical protein
MHRSQSAVRLLLAFSKRFTANAQPNKKRKNKLYTTGDQSDRKATHGSKSRLKPSSPRSTAAVTASVMNNVGDANSVLRSVMLLHPMMACTLYLRAR